MAYTDNISRVSRLSALLLKLQTRSKIKVTDLAESFRVSTRTIYRDLKALVEAGVPIVDYGNGGYGLMEGFRLPPIMFTEAEAHALIMAEKLVAKNKDESLVAVLRQAVDKIRSVLSTTDLSKANFLGDRTIVGKNWNDEYTSNFLVKIQKALASARILHLLYQKKGATPESREVEPFAIYHNTNENWILIGWCRLRKDWRTFRLDRILELKELNQTFDPHQITLEEYVDMQRRKFSKPK